MGGGAGTSCKVSGYPYATSHVNRCLFPSKINGVIVAPTKTNVIIVAPHQQIKKENYIYLGWHRNVLDYSQFKFVVDK